MSINLRRTCVVAVFAVLSIPAASFAADMITHGRETAPKYKVHHHPRAVANVYAAGAPLRCNENIVSYRSPYERHTEVVTVCHPPLNWQTESSTATIWSP